MKAYLSTKLKPFIHVLALPTLLILFSFTLGKGKDGLKLGKKMPMADVEMTGTDDKQHSLESLRQKNGLIVVFSCNTCPFVVGNDNFEGWEKQYNALHEYAGANEIGFVLLNSNEAKRDGDDSLEKMKGHAENMNYQMPYLVDKDSKLADAFGAKTTPHVYVFDAESKLIYKGSIDNTYDSKREEDRSYLREVINHVATNSPLNDASTPPRGCSIKRVK